MPLLQVRRREGTPAAVVALVADSYAPVRASNRASRRQKTTDVKAQCTRCSLSWCVSCLDCRYGQDLAEVAHLADWACPVCLNFCNCSAPNCHRGRMGWLPTNQLVSEATGLGYRSVAHYLILTALEGVPASELSKLDVLKARARQARCVAVQRTQIWWRADSCPVATPRAEPRQQ